MRHRLLPVLLASAELCLGLSLAPRPVQAQTSEIEREWRTLNKAHAAHTRGREAADRGDRAQAETELATAAALYRHLLELNPLRKDLYAPLADTLLRRGNFAAAYAMCVQQVRSGVREVPLQVQLFRALAGMRRQRYALDEAQKALAEAPSDARLQAIVGELAAETGEHDLAIRSLSAALSQAGRALPLTPPLDTGLSVSTLRMTLARSLLSAKRPLEVAAALADLVSSGAADVLLLVGTAQLEASQYAQAVSTLQGILPQLASPLRAQVTVLISLALQKSGRMTDAIAALRQAGDEPICMQALADIYMAEAPPNPAAAAMVLERAAELDPRDLRLCLNFAIVLDKAQKADRAFRELHRCESLNLPESDALTALSLRADLQIKLGRLDEGIASLREARKRSLQAQPGQRPSPKPAPDKRTDAATGFDARLVTALMRRGLQPINTTPLPKKALADLEEARALATLAPVQSQVPAPLAVQTAQALALGLIASLRPGDAVTLLAPLCEDTQAAPSAALLAVFGRALRRNGQPLQALRVMQRAEEIAAAQNDAALRQALHQDQGETLIALGRPLDALRLIEGNDESARRQRAHAFLSAVRAYYQPTQPGQGRGASRRGPFPPLRQGHEQPETRASKEATYPPLRGPIDLSEVQTARGPFPPLRSGQESSTARGPFPPLRAASESPESGPAAAVTATKLPPQGLNDERQALLYAQSALRAGSVLSATERAEAMLYQVVALAHGGQFDLALRRLTEVSSQFDLPTLESLLGPGGFTHLKARLTLRGGDFYQGASLAQQALQQIQPAAARSLQSALAVAYTSKAIDLLDRGERGDVERANSLLRSAQSNAQATSPENQARMQYNLAVLQLYRGRAEEARALLSRLDPQVLPAVWLGLGSYHDLVGDSRTALDQYRRYLQSSEPGDLQLPLVRQWVDVLERIYEGAK